MTKRLSFTYKFTLTFDNKFKGSKTAHREVWAAKTIPPLEKAIKKITNVDAKIAPRSNDDGLMELYFGWSQGYPDKAVYEYPEAFMRMLHTEYMDRQFKCATAGTIRCERVQCDIGRYEY